MPWSRITDGTVGNLDQWFPNGDSFVLPGDVWQFLETLLVAITEHGTPGITCGVRLGMLLNILRAHGRPYTKLLVVINRGLRHCYRLRSLKFSWEKSHSTWGLLEALEPTDAKPWGWGLVLGIPGGSVQWHKQASGVRLPGFGSVSHLAEWPWACTSTSEP